MWIVQIFFSFFFLNVLYDRLNSNIQAFFWSLQGVHDQKDPWEHIKDKQILEDIFPIRAEYLIIGGGIMGAAVAYWLGQMQLGCEIVVVEKDPTFTQVFAIFRDIQEF